MIKMNVLARLSSHLELGSSFNLIQLVCRIQFLVVVGPRSLSPYWMSVGTALYFWNLPEFLTLWSYLQSHQERISLPSNPSHASYLCVQKKPSLF